MGGPQCVHRIYAQEKTMEIPQLKLLAGRVRTLLQQSSSIVGHSQALDLVAALPGLRNWPEVMAFPNHVAACQLDTASAERLAFRLKKNFAVTLTAKEVLSALAPAVPSDGALQVWPGGPPADVYVTTSAQAISALVARYEEATDGGLIYAEAAGTSYGGSIDLGENGLWSAGIDRLPSGTLLVVGPIELDQQMWGESAQRLEMACLHALTSSHRVAVLVNTPTPKLLHEDLVVLLQSVNEERLDAVEALAGIVTDAGELQPRRPFAAGYPKPVAVRVNVGLEALPVSTREVLRREFAARSSGIMLFGSSEIAEHSTYEQLAAALALTDYVGAAARIMSRHRGTPAKDWLVPEAIKPLPFLPSIESAYAQGYRRMIIDPHYCRGSELLEYDDVLFFGGAYGHSATDIALRMIVSGGNDDAKVLGRLVAVLALFHVSGRKGRAVASDLFIRGTSAVPTSTDYSQMESFVRSHLVLRWEDELESLLTVGAVTVTGIKKAARGHHSVLEFLAQRQTVKRRA
jgi:hypothetical protein